MGGGRDPKPAPKRPAQTSWPFRKNNQGKDATSLGRAALVAVLALAGGAAGAPEEGGLVVAIHKSGTQQYLIDRARGFTEAVEGLGFEARTINVELDSNLAVSAVSDAVAAGARGIAVTVPDRALGPALAAAEAGIPLVATDDAIEDSPVPFVGFNGTDMGTKVGQSAAELLTGSGGMGAGDHGVMVIEVETLWVCMERTNAARERLAAAGARDGGQHHHGHAGDLGRGDALLLSGSSPP